MAKKQNGVRRSGNAKDDEVDKEIEGDTGHAEEEEEDKGNMGRKERDDRLLKRKRRETNDSDKIKTWKNSMHIVGGRHSFPVLLQEM